MIHRFIEAEDERHSNHGKFSIMRFDAKELRYRSAVTGGPLLAKLPPVRRFGKSVDGTTLLLLDLQTQEGMLFDPEQGEAEVRRRFLVHPIHVCILYFPLMLMLTRAKDRLWGLPKLVRISLDAVVGQPGVLLDSAGQQVRTRAEWSRRPPLRARLRNREVPVDPEDDQGELEGQDGRTVIDSTPGGDA